MILVGHGRGRCPQPAAPADGGFSGESGGFDNGAAGSGFDAPAPSGGGDGWGNGTAAAADAGGDNWGSTPAVTAGGW